MRRLLVVDDDFGWRALYRLALGDTYEILEARDGVEALEQVRRHSPDLIVLDYHLSGMSGAAVLAALRLLGLTVPAILCTSDPGRGLGGSYEAVVSKSTDLRVLRRTIDEVLAARDTSDPRRAA